MTSQSATRLSAILPAGISLPADFAINDLVLDSRQVKVGDAFVCMQGEAFIAKALEQGAACVLIDTAAADKLDADILQLAGEKLVVIPSLANELPNIAKGHYFREGLSLPKIIGVTGTNGKSSVVAFIAQIFAAVGVKSATIGALGLAVAGSDEIDTGLTTPDILTNYRFIAECAKQGVKVVAMEVSSHGLSQGRVEGITFDSAIFTNLTQDHLDYHGSFAAYGEAKAKLFKTAELGCAIINRDDPFAESLLQTQTANEQLTYALSKPADIVAKNIETFTQGLRFDLVSPWGQIKVTAPVLGHFNIYNILAAATIALKLGVELPALAKAIATLNGVNGRMQLVHKGEVQVIVDFAHTPDGLEQALKAVREHTIGRLIVVFGCGGNRDAQKRALMGAIAEDLADQVVITSDNPRNEDPEKILNDVAAGCKQYPQIIEDRAEAIEYAINHAAVGDSVLIAGKGHENYQLIKDVKKPFSDQEVAKKAIANRAFTNIQGEAS